MQLKKYRKKAQSFLVEGTKSVLELLNANFEVTHLVATESFLLENAKVVTKLKVPLQLVTENQLSSMSALKNNQSALAVARCLPNRKLKINEDEYGLALDRISDPGNLGTIIRTADWYGMKKVVCSEDCADFYNPKVIQACMGSFTRVQVYYTDLKEFLANYANVYAAALEGENVHKMAFEPGAVILIGNEARGISPDLYQLVTNKVSIPRFGGAESLNAAMATAVICDNILRQS